MEFLVSCMDCSGAIAFGSPWAFHKKIFFPGMAHWSYCFLRHALLDSSHLQSGWRFPLGGGSFLASFIQLYRTLLWNLRFHFSELYKKFAAIFCCFVHSCLLDFSGISQKPSILWFSLGKFRIFSMESNRTDSNFRMDRNLRRLLFLGCFQPSTFCLAEETAETPKLFCFFLDAISFLSTLAKMAKKLFSGTGKTNRDIPAPRQHWPI